MQNYFKNRKCFKIFEMKTKQISLKFSNYKYPLLNFTESNYS